MSVAEEPLDLLADYRRETRGYDEAVDEQGRVRGSHAGALRALAGRDLEALASTVDEQVAGEGVCFHSAVGDEAFVIDPVPRVIGADEWATIEAGLAQRVRALNAFIADVYAKRRIVDEGVVPERVIDTAEYHEPAMNGVRPPGDIWIGISGLDLVRDAHGNFQVLEDNVRTPSGYSYAAAARRALAAQLDLAPEDAPRPLDDLPELLRFALEAAAPTPGRSRIALLTDGARERRLLRARVGRQGDRRPADRAGGAGRARRHRHRLPPHQRRSARHEGRPAAARPDPQGPASRSSTASAPGSPTTSSPTPTSRT